MYWVGNVSAKDSGALGLKLWFFRDSPVFLKNEARVNRPTDNVYTYNVPFRNTECKKEIKIAHDSAEAENYAFPIEYTTASMNTT